jgi:haloacetate dehalogenase
MSVQPHGATRAGALSADFELVGQAFDVIGVWKSMAKNIRGVAIPRCGHLPQEEQPERVNQELREFLNG